MSDWMTTLLQDVSELEGVEEVTLADEAGCYIAGINNEDPDEMAAITTFTGRAALTSGDILALEDLQAVSVIGKKNKMLVYPLSSNMLGVRLGESAIISKLEMSLNDLIAEALEDA